MRPESLSTKGINQLAINNAKNNPNSKTVIRVPTNMTPKIARAIAPNRHA
jgi:hypothetical protein